MSSDTEALITTIKSAQQRTVLLGEDLATIDRLARKLIAGQPQEPDPPTDPLPWYGVQTDDQIWERIKARFIELSTANGYAASEGYPGAGGSDADRAAVAAEWVSLAKSADGWDEVDATITADIAQYWPPKGAPVDPKDPEPPVIVDGDEVLSVDIVMRSMNRSLPHEVVPSIAETFPSWGVLLQNVFTPETNPTSGPYPSTPPRLSQRTKARGWFVAAATRGKPNTATNSALLITRAQTLLLLKGGGWQAGEARFYDGNMTLDLGMVYGKDDPPVKFVQTPRGRAVFGIGNKQLDGGIYAGRNWHPTIADVVPGGQLRTKVANTLVVVGAVMVPIDASKPHDWEAANQCLYAGEDNYDPQQDGFSGRFLRVTDRVRWICAWDGDAQTLRDNPPPLPGWQA